MVTFNLHHGQSRIAATYEAKPVGMKWRQLTPKRMLMFAVKDGRKLLKVSVEADALGDVEVTTPAVMEHLAILGYPIHRSPAELVDCDRLHDVRCFNDSRLEHNDRCGRCATGFGHEELIFRQSDRSDDPLAAALPDEAVHLKPYRHIMHPVELDGAFHCWCEGVFSSG